MKKKIMAAMCVALCITVFFNDIVWAAEYEYDKLGRVTKVTYEDKSSITYEYDANGNIVSVTRTEGEQGTKPQIPQETAPGQEETAFEPEQETSGSSQEDETKAQEDGAQGNAGQENGKQDNDVSGNGIKEPGNIAFQIVNGSGNAETAGGESKEPAGTTGISGTEQNPSEETVTEKGTIGIDETISGTENITDEKSDNGKIGFWQKVWNVVTGFFLWLWSVIKSFFLWLWSLLKGLFELIFGN